MKENVLVIGGSSYVGSKFIEQNRDFIDIEAPSSQELNLLDLQSIQSYVDRSKAHVVVNFAAIADVDAAEKETGDTNGLVYRLNTMAVGDLATTCISLGKYLIHISTDYIFDGEKADAPYKEDDIANPVNWYGKTKYLGESAFLESGCHGVIARIEMPFTAHSDKKGDFARFFYSNLTSGKPITTPQQNITPLFLDDLSASLMALIEQKPDGIYHIATPTLTTPEEVARKIAQLGGFDESLIHAILFEDFNAKRIAKRPKNSWLNTSKFRGDFGDGILHSLDDALALFLEQMKIAENR